MPLDRIKNLFRPERQQLGQHVLALVSVGITLLIVGVLHSTVVDPPAAI